MLWARTRPRSRVSGRMRWGWLLAVLASACAEAVSGDRTEGPGGLELLFQTQVEGARNTFVPTSDGQRLYADVDRRIEAFDLETGARLWSYRRPPGGPSALVARGGRVTFAGDSVVALDAATGRELWRRGLDSHAGFAESDGDAEAFYTGTEQRRIYAFRASDGAVLWERQLGADWPHGGLVRGLTLSGDTVFAVLEHHTGINGHIGTGDVFAMDRRTGEVLWTYRNGDGTRLSIFQSAGRVAGGLLILSANWENHFVAVNRGSGAEAWRAVGGVGFAGPQEAPEVQAGRVYAASHDQQARALDLATGRELWSIPVNGGANWLAICGTRLLVSASGLNVLELSSGRMLGRGYGGEVNEVLGTDFVVVGNRAYVFGLRHVYGFRCPS
jgi:outer membrane protein assembly factor BamB